ncbi:hypothetical protein HANVADRAFT_52631 [Hanseniaspora valbyensis NRRL Y-1626]|uniref:Amino acid transporter transmembrane domain-containing protein n=1 Tax=Hanseniaspora valbyensis NRRL Y-1626 TaxID=766949 RepID=A0A1B7TEH1_9ASCO|nr:hypothetical protein HANVADRAFT_52631 [Hanseniaspora valbyensis NRRL Y-1626]
MEDPNEHESYISIPISIARRNSKSVPNQNNNNEQNIYGSLLTNTDANTSSYSNSSYQHQQQHTPSMSILGSSPFKGPNSFKRFQSSYQRANSFKSIELNAGKERSYFNTTNNNTDSNPQFYDQLIDYDTIGASLNGRRVSMAVTGNNNSIINKRSKSNLLNNNNNNNFSNLDPIISNTDFIPAETSPSNPLLNPDYQGLQIVASNNTNKLNDINNILIQKLKSEKLNNKTVIKLVGQSTQPQTIFNSINVLIGIGVFALPLGMKYAGWILGVPMLCIFAVTTFFTAELLSRCLDTDPSLISYGDLGYASFGATGRALISLLFSFDLLGSGVSLFILFGDSLNALFPEISVTQFKVYGFFLIFPLSFVPLNILSNLSLLGIGSTMGTIMIILMCGIWKKSSPGSLIDPSKTSLWPDNFYDFCLSIGLLSASWGGHAIFPNLKNDMRHPKAFKSCLKYTYLITSITDIGTAILGFLMFGEKVDNEVTRNVLNTSGYPQFVYYSVSALMSFIPLAKTPLNCLPIVSILDVLTGVKSNSNNEIMENDLNENDLAIESEDEDDNLTPKSSLGEFVSEKTTVFKSSMSIVNKLFVNALFLGTSIVFPEFDKILALLGAGLCFIICFILPCLFYMRMCADTIKPWEKNLCHFIIFVSIILSVLGVTAAVL